ncbi:MAG: phage holin family protein [Kutzneria sp.]|nr:phage holin family protein [Kutzneria sp.]MBV9844667.1 phage holin family protein [Kutzneria sp.]
MSGGPGDAPGGDHSLARLIGEASEQLSRLVRDEMRLAAAELRQKGKRAGTGAAFVGGASALGLYGGGALIASAILALTIVFAPWLAALIVGAAALVVAAIAALIGKKLVSAAVPPVPEGAAASVKADIEAVKEGLNR